MGLERIHFVHGDGAREALDEHFSGGRSWFPRVHWRAGVRSGTIRRSRRSAIGSARVWHTLRIARADQHPGIGPIRADTGFVRAAQAAPAALRPWFALIQATAIANPIAAGITLRHIG